MSRQAKEEHGLQVFPFLAVLVCTMGALIFLLLVTTSQIRHRPADADSLVAPPELGASDEPSSLKPPARGFPDSEIPVDSATIVIPPQPPRETSAPPKRVKVPDQSYALALAQREREISELTTKWKVRTNILAKERKRYEAAIKEHKALFDAAVEQADLLKSDVTKYEGQLDQIEQDAAAAAADKKDDIERLKIEKQIAELKRKLLAAQAAEASAENEKFQVIPFDVTTGTTRRPIFIECTATGIRFQPENIQITPADLDGFPTNINPLAAGTGALINYWAEQNRKQRGAKADPYILLLVRPDGVLAYYVALRMLEPIRTSHGYELVDDKMKLQFPEADPGAREVCQTAVDHILSERASITKAAVARSGSASVFGGALRSNYGGGGGPGGPGNGFAGGTGSGSGPGSGQGPGRPGTGSNSSGNGFSVNDVTNEKTTVGTRSWERVENFMGERPQKRRAAANGVASNGNATGNAGGNVSGNGTTGAGIRSSTSSDGASSGRETFAGSSTGGLTGMPRGNSSVQGGQPGSPPPSGNAVAGGTPAGRPTSGKSMFGDEDDPAPVVSGLGETGNNGSAVSQGSRPQNGKPSVFGLNGSVIDAVPEGSSQAESTTSNGQRGSAMAQRGSGQSGGGLAGTPQEGSGQFVEGQPESDSTGSDQPGGAMSQGGSQTAVSGNSGSGGNRRGGSGRSGRGVNAGDSFDSMPINGSVAEMPTGERPGKKKKSAQPDVDDLGEMADDSAEEEVSGSGSGSGSGHASRGQRGMLSDNSGAGLPDPNGNRPSSNSTASRAKPSSESTERQLEPEMLAGRRWGLCEQGSTIGLERDVRVDVSTDKMVIAGRYEIPGGENATRQEMFEYFATQLDRHSREWGRPPQGFHWTPRLKFIVKPEAYGQYEIMNSFMTRAGLATSHEFAKSNERIEFGRDDAGVSKPTVKQAVKTTSGGTR